LDESSAGVQLITLYTRVLLYLAQNPKISQETLARRLDVTMRTVQRHLSELEREGYLRVDRDKKPFQYSIEWSKAVPHMPWMRVIALHPEVIPALHGLSDVASRTYEEAVKAGQDPAGALHAIFEVPTIVPESAVAG